MKGGEMARKVIQRVLLAAGLIGLTGCAATFWAGKQSATLNLGMSKERVQAMLGLPQDVVTQQFQDLMVETWKYLDRTVVFHNGILYGWEVPPRLPEAGTQRDQGTSG